jgi:uncharacterized protein (DUF302 family)
MRNYWYGATIGVISGILLMGILMYRAAPNIMLKEKATKYDFDESIKILESSILEKNWTIPVAHDLQASLKKFGYDVRKVKVFEICKPDYAAEILEGTDERIVSAMMPCRIAIYEKENGKVFASFMNSSVMAGAMGGKVKKVMNPATEELKVILSPILVE